MIYADSDFFLALLMGSDRLKASTKRLLDKHRGALWTSPITLIELLRVAEEYGLDPERLLVDVLEIARFVGGEARYFLIASNCIKHCQIGVSDALHAAYCEDSRIIS